MSNSDEREYKNLHTWGEGDLYRFRRVSVRKGDDFFAVDVDGQHGPVDDLEHIHIQCIVRGEETAKVIDSLKEEINSMKKVYVRFLIGDLFHGKPYKASLSDNTTEIRVPLKGRLLFIKWAKIDGKIVYEAPEKEKVNPAIKQEQAAA